MNAARIAALHRGQPGEAGYLGQPGEAGYLGRECLEPAEAPLFPGSACPASVSTVVTAKATAISPFQLLADPSEQLLDAFACRGCNARDTK